MGSKARIAKDIVPIILENRKENQYYIEPFAGGMNTIDKVNGLRIANDINTYLISMWAALVNDGWKPTKISKDYYATIKQYKSIYPKYVVGWVGFNCSYSGKFFGGFAGDTLTKIGTIRDYQTEAIKNVLKQVDKLKGVRFTNLSYEKIILPKNSIIYCDIPYKDTTKYNSDFKHAEFYKWALLKAKEGHSVFISEYNMPKDFTCVWSKEVASSLSANGKIGGNKISVEKLFVVK